MVYNGARLTFPKYITAPIIKTLIKAEISKVDHIQFKESPFAPLPPLLYYVTEVWNTELLLQKNLLLSTLTMIANCSLSPQGPFVMLQTSLRGPRLSRSTY